MAWTSIGYYEDRTGTTTFTPVAALADDTVRVSGDDVTVPTRFQEVISAFGTLSNATDLITGLQLSAPSLRATTLLDCPILRKIAAGSAYTPPAYGNEVNKFLGGVQRPRVLTAGEKLNALVRSSAATVNDLISVVVQLGDGNYVNPLAGQPVETIELTSASAMVANTWTSSVLTPVQTLRAGRYAIVGMEAKLTTGKQARLIFTEDNAIFPGQGVARPGVYPYNGAVAGFGMKEYRLGNMGILGTFTQDSPPTLEGFRTAADTAATTFVYLDVVKIG